MGAYQAMICRVYTIHGGKELPEEELPHLAGHKDSKPVRIGNGAVDHLQLVSTLESGRKLNVC